MAFFSNRSDAGLLTLGERLGLNSDCQKFEERLMNERRRNEGDRKIIVNLGGLRIKECEEMSTKAHSRE